MTTDAFDMQTDGDPVDPHRFPCSACGADMGFDPLTNGLTCGHCGHREGIDTSDAPRIVELNLEDSGPVAPWGGDAQHEDFDAEETLRLSECTSCGAQVEFPDATQATSCPYCAAPVVARDHPRRLHKPSGVLPFELSQDAARDALSDWLGSRWFAPSGLANYARKGRTMRGIYTPYWTYDAQTRTQYSGQRGDDYYVTIHVNGKSQRKRKTRWRHVSGKVARFFDDVLVPAAHSLPRKDLDALEPWDLPALRPYTPSFLAGFAAEAYTISREDGHARAKERMERVIERDVRFDIGGDRQRILDMRVKMSNQTYKHILLPVWTAVFKFRSKTYRVVINGQSGRVAGERPYSIIKIFLAGMLAAAFFGAILYLNATSQGG